MSDITSAIPCKALDASYLRNSKEHYVLLLVHLLSTESHIDRTLQGGAKIRTLFSSGENNTLRMSV